MQRYLGVKLIEAQPAFMLDGTIYPKDKPYPRAMGLKDGYQVVYPDGYESWSPKATFEEAYRPINNMNFGLALEAVKKGFKIAREGWNEGMFVVYQKGYPLEIPSMWTPSINDCLAEDWCIVD